MLAQKRRAIEAHRSQFGLVVDDDPNGFTMTPQVLQNFTRPNEGYFEFRDTYAYRAPAGPAPRRIAP